MSQQQKPYSTAPRDRATPRVDLLADLLEICDEEQLEQFVRLMRQARENSAMTTNGVGAGMYVDVRVRWRAKTLRYMGLEIWEQAKK